MFHRELPWLAHPRGNCPAGREVPISMPLQLLAPGRAGICHDIRNIQQEVAELMLATSKLRECFLLAQLLGWIDEHVNHFRCQILRRACSEEAYNSEVDVAIHRNIRDDAWGSGGHSIVHGASAGASFKECWLDDGQRSAHDRQLIVLGDEP